MLKKLSLCERNFSKCVKTDEKIFVRDPNIYKNLQFDKNMNKHQLLVQKTETVQVGAVSRAQILKRTELLFSWKFF